MTGKALANGTGSLYTTAEDAAEDVDGTFLKDVTIKDGAFSTTVEAKDLKKNDDDGKSELMVVDANGGEASATFQVTGTTVVGSDSVGKGKMLKISISDWITDLPDNVKIGGEDHDIVDEDGDDYTVDLDDGADTFYVKVSGDVRLGTKSVVLFKGDSRLDGSSVEITAIGLNVSLDEAVSGQEITVEGSGFGSGQLASLTVGGKEQTELSNREPIDEYDILSGGRVVLSFVVPPEVTHGEKTILITAGNDRVGEVSIDIIKPAITLTPAEGRRGTEVTVEGTGFPAAKNITVDYGPDETGIASGRTDSAGSFSASFRVPTSAGIGAEVKVKASHTIADTNADSDSADTLYSAEDTHMVPGKEITVTPDTVVSGDTINIEGTGFPRYSDVGVKFASGGWRATTARTDGVGDFDVSVIVPGLDPGTHVLQVRAANTDDGESASWVLEVVDTPVGPVITATAELFEPLGDNLERVYHYVNATGEWLVYDPRPDFAEFNTYTESTGGQAVWVKVTNAAQFQGEPLFAGWNLIVLR